jgi:hypothetical protein
MNNHNRGIKMEDETDLRDQERIQNFGKQASLRELENTGVDRRILKQKSFILLQTKCVPE